MVDYIIKKSPYKAADVVNHTVQDAKLSSEKIEEYVRTLSKKTSPNKYNRPVSKANSNYKSKRKVKPSMKTSKSTSILESGSRLKGRSWDNQSNFRSIMIAGSAKSKIKWYERAKEILNEGGINPKNIDKQFILPQKKSIYNSRSIKRSMQASPPRFTPHPHTYSDNKTRDANNVNDQKEQQILNEWTFTPQISNPNEYVRNADEFYEDQQRHVIDKFDRLKMIDRDIQHKENITHRPYLSKISEEIANKNRVNTQPIHERLYSDYNTKKMKEGVSVLMNIKNSYKKVKRKKNESRHLWIEEYLYNDAMVRQKSKSKNAKRSVSRGSSNMTSIASQMYAKKKVIKDITSLWEFIARDTRSSIVDNSLNLTENNELLEQRFNMISTAYLFTAMGYLSKTSNSDSYEKNLFYDLWTLLRGEESNGITFESAKTILITILGFNSGTECEDNGSNGTNVVYSKIGNIMNEDYTDWVISKKQANLIKQTFKKFKLNKVQSKQKGEIIKSASMFKDEWIFKPSLTPYSSELASKKRSCNGGYKFYESLTEKMRETNEWKLKQREKKEQELMKECTFTPELATNFNTGVNSIYRSKSERSLMGNKSVERWAKYKNIEYPVNYSMDHNISSQFNTHHRKSNKSAVILKHAKYTSTVNRKSINKSVQRIREAAYEKEIVRVMTENGV
jgi:hypothetical protein